MTGHRASSLTPRPCLHLCTLTLQSVSSVNEVRNPRNKKTKTKSLLRSLQCVVFPLEKYAGNVLFPARHSKWCNDFCSLILLPSWFQDINNQVWANPLTFQVSSKTPQLSSSMCRFVQCTSPRQGFLLFFLKKQVCLDSMLPRAFALPILRSPKCCLRRAIGFFLEFSSIVHPFLYLNTEWSFAKKRNPEAPMLN